MLMSRGVGAPKGGRVHWILHNLPSEFKAAYKLYYNYASHNYVFIRLIGKTKRLYDVFVVQRTSKHYFRVMYACPERSVFENFGDRRPKAVAMRMWFLYKKGEKYVGREEG